MYPSACTNGSHLCFFVHDRSLGGNALPYQLQTRTSVLKEQGGLVGRGGEGLLRVQRNTSHLECCDVVFYSSSQQGGRRHHRGRKRTLTVKPMGPQLAMLDRCNASQTQCSGCKSAFRVRYSWVKPQLDVMISIGLSCSCGRAILPT